MNSLGQLQTEVWEEIKKAAKTGEPRLLGILGTIAAEMDEKAREWSERMATGSRDEGAGWLGKTISAAVAQVTAEGERERDEDYTGRSIRGATLFGERLAVGNFKDLLLEVVSQLRRKHPDRFDEVAPGVRGHNPYFSGQPDDLRSAHRIEGSRLWVEKNLNANLIVQICRRLLDQFGHKGADLVLDVSPYRTRAIKGAR